ncbi:hypothetical protein [Actinomadura alba]|uniref:Uncharacterized protein n=1 Tax=Actinomadura alba TaxID=406431 RepID=A0ABR7LX83_9ACTN|nr:hypothetical protein [Actinomadura alba]MBC6469293.1 hypothetical protein [Actinomadura alba]
MDTRTDPVEIIARVGERDGRQRAFDVWVHKAMKAGWAVAVESTSLDRPGTECGVVEIEGLRYRIHHGKRVRGTVAIVPAGQHLIAATVKLTMGESDGVSFTSEFVHAAWVEPLVDEPA